MWQTAAHVAAEQQTGTATIFQRKDKAYYLQHCFVGEESPLPSFPY